MFKKLDEFLNTITMYRSVLYGLLWLAGVAIVLSFFDIVQYSPLTLFASLGILLTVSFVSNVFIARLYSVAANHESSLISALILFFVISPPHATTGFVGIAVAALIAVVSKYVIAWRGAHIFNPAAFAAFLASVAGLGLAGWWIASKALIIPMIIVGFLVLKKTRRFQLFFAFTIPAVGLLVFNGVALEVILFSFPLLFLGTIMLTDPATMPGTKLQKLVFGWTVGLVFGAQLQAGFLSTSPHMALLFGNVIALVLSFRTGVILTLVEKIQLSPTTYDFSFSASRKVVFTAGQYIETTLQGVGLDSRGNRRSFTIASSPDDRLLHIGVKFYENGSRFKDKLHKMKPGDTVLGAHVAGDFILPDNPRIPLVFFAGGIGITPFISHIKHMRSHGEVRDITLHHFINSDGEKVYQSVLESAQEIGVKVVYHIGKTSPLEDQAIMANQHAWWYISGPPPMVGAYKKRLKKLSVSKVKTDYFSGY